MGLYVLDDVQPEAGQADLLARGTEHAQLAEAEVGEDLAAGAVAAPLAERMAARRLGGATGLLPDPRQQRIGVGVVAQQPDTDGKPSRGHALSEWRRNGAGGQILADLGLGKLRVLGTPRKQIGLAGFGLEVVEYVNAAGS